MNRRSFFSRLSGAVAGCYLALHVALPTRKTFFIGGHELMYNPAFQAARFQRMQWTSSDGEVYCCTIDRFGDNAAEHIAAFHTKIAVEYMGSVSDFDIQRYNEPGKPIPHVILA